MRGPLYFCQELIFFYWKNCNSVARQSLDLASAIGSRDIESGFWFCKKNKIKSQRNLNQDLSMVSFENCVNIWSYLEFFISSFLRIARVKVEHKGTRLKCRCQRQGMNAEKLLTREFELDGSNCSGHHRTRTICRLSFWFDACPLYGLIALHQIIPLE